MKPARAVLSAVPGFAAASIEQQLADGPVSSSYLVTRQGRRFVLRIDKPAVHALGLDRDNEIRVHEAVAAAGMASRLVFHDAGKGILLRSYLPGRNWSAADLAEPGNLQRLGRLLRRLHGLPPVGKVFEPLQAARRYARLLAVGAGDAGLQRMQVIARKLERFTRKPVLCHNDLVCQNILEGESLLLIDWEYAAVGDGFFDLAVVLQHHGLGGGHAEQLLRSYLGREATTDEQTRLAMQRQFYQCLLELWRLASEGA